METVKITKIVAPPGHAFFILGSVLSGKELTGTFKEDNFPKDFANWTDRIENEGINSRQPRGSLCPRLDFSGFYDTV